MSLTADFLINAIRSAESLAELRRLVGPSVEEQRLAQQRLAKIDRLFEQYDNPEAMPLGAKLHYEFLNKEQQLYENTYC